MKIRFTASFKTRLLSQISYIAQDSPTRAKKFHQELLLKVNTIPQRPYSFRKSIYFDDTAIRDLIFKGYVVVFRLTDDSVEVFGFVKHQEKLDSK